MRILEGGHFYASKGPTPHASMGWQILEDFREGGDKTMLFIDDVHLMDDVPEQEIGLPVIEFSPQADFVVMESQMSNWGLQVLERLKQLPRKSRAKPMNGNGAWFCSGSKLTANDGKPLCLLLDVGLTLYKQHLGFNHGVNVLPSFWEAEQRALLKLVNKAMPDFHLDVFLFTPDMKIRHLDV